METNETNNKPGKIINFYTARQELPKSKEKKQALIDLEEQRRPLVKIHIQKPSPREIVEKLIKTVDTNASFQKVNSLNSQNRRPTIQSLTDLLSALADLQSHDVDAQLLYPPQTLSLQEMQDYYSKHPKGNVYLVADQHQETSKDHEGRENALKNTAILSKLSDDLDIDYILGEGSNPYGDNSLEEALSSETIIPSNVLATRLREQGADTPIIPAETPSLMILAIAANLLESIMIKEIVSKQDPQDIPIAERLTQYITKNLHSALSDVNTGEPNPDKVTLYNKYIKNLVKNFGLETSFDVVKRTLRRNGEDLMELNFPKYTGDYENIASEYENIQELTRYITNDKRNQSITARFTPGNNILMALGSRHILHKKNNETKSIINNLENKGFSVHVIKLENIRSSTQNFEGELAKHHLTSSDRLPLTEQPNETIILKGEKVTSSKTLEEIEQYNSLGIDRPGALRA